MTTPPTGTVTFLFTDIQGSTRLWEEQPDAMRPALARHDALLRTAIESSGGHVFKTVGDAFCAAFAAPANAANAAIALQRALAQAHHAPGTELALKVRAALHAGAAESRDGDYFGPALNRVARLLATGHGGQVLVSEATQALVRDDLPHGSHLRDLGRHRLRDLQRPEQVFQLLHPDLPADFPPLRSLDTLPNNLPRQFTSFVGREREMEDVKQLLRSSRLLTITGAGGTGKTRMILQVAADLLEGDGDGVWFTELAPVADPGMVPRAVAGALGVDEQPGKSMLETLLAFLRPRRLLLVLDNCEHLLHATAELVQALLRGCPHLVVLASSRESLAIPGETTYRLPSLSLPSARTQNTVEALSQFEAVRLFIDRAAAVLPTFRVTQKNAPAVTQICCRLDGIPFAIELAAARVKALPAEQIAARLDDRFHLLTAGSRTALPRHQTLRALIDWSHALLSEPERTLLRRLSVFPGDWSLEAAETVGGDGEVERWEVLDHLAMLVEKSLVVYEDAAGEARYRLLETVREYTRERLRETGEEAAVRDRHLEHYAALAAEAERGLRGAGQLAWLDRLDTEHDSFRAALGWALPATPAPSEPRRLELGVRLATSLHGFWIVRGHYTEAQQWLQRSQPRLAEVALDARAPALTAAMWVAIFQGELGRLPALAGEAAVVGVPEGALTLWMMSVRMLAGAYSGQTEEAAALAGEIERRLPGERDPWVAGFACNSLLMLAFAREDYAAVTRLAERAGAASHRSGDLINRPSVVGLGGLAALHLGDLPGAEAAFREILGLAETLKSWRVLNAALVGFAALFCRRDEPERAVRLLGAAEAQRERNAVSLLPWGVRLVEDVSTAARGALGEEAFRAAWAAGGALSMEQALACALAAPCESA